MRVLQTRTKFRNFHQRLHVEMRRPSTQVARGLIAVLLLGVVASGLALFVLFTAIFSGVSIGGASAELEAVYRAEDRFNLIGAGVVAVAFMVAGCSVHGWHRSRLMVCLALTAVCVFGGLAAQYGLRHSPAELDPNGGHRIGEFHEGRIYWKPLALFAGICAAAVAVEVTAKRSGRTSRTRTSGQRPQISDL